MKIRQGFVSNSSSSSFIVTDGNHPAFHFLLAMECIGDYFIENGRVEDNSDNGTWNMIRKYDRVTGQQTDYTDFLYQTSFDG